MRSCSNAPSWKKGSADHNHDWPVKGIIADSGLLVLVPLVLVLFGFWALAPRCHYDKFMGPRHHLYWLARCFTHGWAGPVIPSKSLAFLAIAIFSASPCQRVCFQQSKWSCMWGSVSTKNVVQHQFTDAFRQGSVWIEATFAVQNYFACHAKTNQDPRPISEINSTRRQDGSEEAATASGT